MRAQLDHVVVGIRALDEGIAAFEGLTGVVALKGGRHPDRGTENALVSLGRGRYLELVAPRSDAAPSAGLDAMRALERLTVVAWAVGLTDMDAARQALAAAGITLGGDSPGARVTPSGATLEWSTAAVTAPHIATAPFFIQWKTSTPHPSTTSPPGCALSSMEIHDPTATELSRALDALRVNGVTVRRGQALVRLTLTCGDRPVILASR